MSAIVVAGDTSGSITLQAPAVAGSNTFTLPAATGTVMVSGNMPAFSVWLSGSQNVTSSVITKIQFNTKEFDTANCFDATTNYRFTPNVGGYYQLSLSMTPSGTAITGEDIYIYKNGSQYKRLCSGLTAVGLTGSCLVYLNGSTDYIEFYGDVSATSPQFYTGQNYTFATGALIRN